MSAAGLGRNRCVEKSCDTWRGNQNRLQCEDVGAPGLPRFWAQFQVWHVSKHKKMRALPCVDDTWRPRDLTGGANIWVSDVTAQVRCPGQEGLHDRGKLEADRVGLGRGWSGFGSPFYVFFPMVYCARIVAEGSGQIVEGVDPSVAQVKDFCSTRTHSRWATKCHTSVRSCQLQ